MASITVTSTSDVVNGITTNIANLIANPGADGISLREAIIAANNTTGADTINLSTVSGTITLAGTQLDISDSVTIQGSGASNLSISGNNASRVISITAGIVSIDGLTIRNGKIGGIGVGNYGAGIYVAGGSSLNLSNSIVSANSGYNTGGIYISINGTAIISNSTISANSAFGAAGVGNLGTAIISNSTISANSAYIVGGISNVGTATINNSTISANSATTNSGGIFNAGPLTISNSTISANSATYGGGIFNGSPLTISNSTISANSATNFGGGIANLFDTVTINNSTISANSAGQRGGGIANLVGTTTISSSIVAGNNSAIGAEVQNLATFTSRGNNLVGQNGNAGGFPNLVASDIILAGAISTVIAPLDNNGGFQTGAPGLQQPIFTHALVPGSPAIDKGIANGLTTDQRGLGFSRVSGLIADIGAFEVQVATPLPDLAISKTVSSQIVNGGQSVTFTITVSNIGQAVASNITVSDALPSGLAFVTATATGGFSTPNGTDSSRNLNFTGGSLAAGGSATLTVVVNAPNNLSANGYTNVATVDPLNTIAESNENNNTASANVGVIPVSAAPPIGEPIPNNKPIIPPNPIPGGFVSGFFPDLPPGTFITPELQGNTEGQAINGTDSNNILTGGAGNDTIRGGRGDDIIYGYGGDNLLIGGRGNDILYGGKGNDTLIGTNANNAGKGERDILTGNGGVNLFVLGDVQSAYYDDGDSNNSGLNDYALITDFNLSQDSIQLKSNLNYLIDASPSGLPSGAAIFIDNDGIPGLSANDELIGILSGLSANNASAIIARFQFV